MDEQPGPRYQPQPLDRPAGAAAHGSGKLGCYTLPFWEKVSDLCKEVSLLFPQLPSVGTEPYTWVLESICTYICNLQKLLPAI